MATRSLGRTVIECGRPNSSKRDRAKRNASLRKWKLVDGEYEPGPLKGEGRELSDDLGVLRRWLDSKVGQRWDDVYSEFCEREDRRTLRGWHIHSHLDYMVATSTEVVNYRYWDFYVDWEGRLQLYKGHSVAKPDPRYAEFKEWMGDRKFYPVSKDHFIWAQRRARKSLTPGKTYDYYWGWGEELTPKEMGTVTQYPKWIWKRFLLSNWEVGS